MRSSRKTVYIVGASGFVGQYLRQWANGIGCKVVATGWPERLAGLRYLDLTSRESVKDALRDVEKGDVIVLTAAQAFVDWCEINPEESFKVNVGGVELVSRVAKASGARLVFLSSEYVFDGLAGPYSEDDRVKPINEYGKQKLQAEKLLSSLVESYLVIRTTTVFGFEEANKNFLMTLLKRVRDDDSVLVPEDQISTPTYVRDLAAITGQLALEDGIRGIINVVGPDRMSRVELALAICKAFKLSADKVKPVATKELGQPAARPLSAGLRIERLLKLNMNPLSVEAALADVAKSRATAMMSA